MLGFAPLAAAPLASAGSVRQLSLGAGTGAVLLAGPGAFGARASRLVAPPRTFGLAGLAAAMRASRVLAPGSGAVATAGAAVAPRRDRFLLATSGAGTLAPRAAALLHGYTLAVSPAARAIASASPALRAARSGRCLPGGMSLAGCPVTLRRTVLLSASDGALNFAGLGAAMRGSRLLVPGSGTVALAGAAVAPRRDRSMLATSGVGTLAPRATALLHGHTLAVSPTACAIVSASPALRAARWGRSMPAGVSLAASPVTLRRTMLLPAWAGAAGITSLPARLAPFRNAPCGAGTVTVACGPFWPAVHHGVALAPSSLHLAGRVAFDLQRDRPMAVSCAMLSLAGTRAALSWLRLAPPMWRIARVVAVPRIASFTILHLCGAIMTDLAWPPKRVAERLDYQIDWADALGADRIEGATVTRLAGSAVCTDVWIGDRSVTMWLTGGVPRELTRFAVAIDTVAGRRMSTVAAMRCEADA